ncbi:unnamed protein product [Thelazia callipaeda]|uniref:Coiled-coil domain-containing protein 12 n=1 Tax=Thelazia callipaeda TaxID=103827 RepID=A0A0N5CXL3_THECL|nr:unnamed protein product [Thelazia callipaeda]
MASDEKVKSEMMEVSVEEEPLDIAENSISLEKAAIERKQKLREMRDRVLEKEDAESESSNKMKLTFRNYEPQSDIGDKNDGVDLFTVEKEIADHFVETHDTSVVEKIDITTLAPRKIDWDLKRDVAAKLEKLERRTERAIAQLIRDRLKLGTTELTDAVSSGAYCGLDADD